MRLAHAPFIFLAQMHQRHDQKVGQEGAPLALGLRDQGLQGVVESGTIPVPSMTVWLGP